MDHWIQDSSLLPYDTPVKCAQYFTTVSDWISCGFSVFASFQRGRISDWISSRIFSFLPCSWQERIFVSLVLELHVYQDPLLYPMIHLWSLLVIFPPLIAFYIGVWVFALFLTRKDFSPLILHYTPRLFTIHLDTYVKCSCYFTSSSWISCRILIFCCSWKERIVYC